MLRLGVIGLGIMGERMIRAAVEQAADSVAISGVWDPDGRACARVTDEFPVVSPGSAEAVIRGADCVYVASPPGSHLAHAGRILGAGKALFCEKPLAVDVAAATAFVALTKGARAAVNFPFASSFAVERLAGWLAEGAVGAPVSVAIEVGFATWPRGWQADAAGWLDRPEQGGFTREVVSHLLFLTQRLVGAVALREGSAVFEGGRSETSIAARLTAGEVPVTLAGGVGTTDKDDTNCWTLTGAAGRIRLRDWGFAERWVDGAWVGDAGAVSNAAMRPLVLQRQLARVAAMTAGRAHSLATLGEALAVQIAVEGILRG